jgi:hypothetical protein
MKNYAVLTVVGLLFAPGVASAECDALSRYGIHDLRIEATDAERTMSYRNWFCQQQFSSAEDANASGLDSDTGR